MQVSSPESCFILKIQQFELPSFHSAWQVLSTNVASPYKALQRGINVSANNSETVGHKDLRFGQIVYILVFYNISFSWLLPLDGFQFIVLCRVYCVSMKNKTMKHIMDNLIKSNCRLMTLGGVLPFLVYKGMCHWTGYGFFASLS